MKSVPLSILSLSLIGLLAPSTLAGPDEHKHDAGHEHTHDGQAQKSLKDLLPPMKKPDLWIGSEAPDMTIAKYLKGEAVGAFDPDHTYVVEFWATWCGPCIAAFPHLSELQEQYDGDVTFIGVNIWERTQGDERMNQVERFVENQGDRMGYTVAIEDGTSMATNWMRPAGQNAIPAAFIVQEGKIAWMGHPMALDGTLEAIAEGEYDIEHTAKQAWDERIAQAGVQTFHGALGAEDWEKALDLGEALANEMFSDNAGSLNMIAWYALSSEDAPQSIQSFGLRSAAQACKLTDWKDWMALDTYARGMFVTGDSNSAVKFQKKAIELAKQDERVNEEILSQLRETLDEYEH